MSAQTVDPTAVEEWRGVEESMGVEELMGRVLADLSAAAGLQTIQLGIRTGLWKAMAGAGPLTAAQVAERAGVARPYAREWLKHQAVSGYVRYRPGTGTFELPEAAAAVLADDTQSGLVDGFAQMLGAMAVDNAMVVEAYRTGGGVGWHQRSAEHWHGMDLVTRAAVVPALVAGWLPALDGIADKLARGGTVADVGCGYGAAALAIAETYPATRVFGFDYSDGSIAQARKAAARARVSDRTTFEVAEATGFGGTGYDLIVFIDTFHDLGDPVGALRHARRALAGDGAVLLVEFAAGDRLEDNANPLGRLLYASSALVCTPNAIAQGAVDPLGTAPGETRLAEVAGHAGFTSVRRVPAEAPLNMLLELRP